MKKSRLNIFLLVVILIGLIILISRGEKPELEVIPELKSDEVDVSIIDPKYRMLCDFEYAYYYHLNNKGYNRHFWWNGDTYYLENSGKEIIPENYLIN